MGMVTEFFQDFLGLAPEAEVPTFVRKEAP